MNAPARTITKPRRWLQFKLRTVFVALTLAAIGLGAGLKVVKYVWWEAWLAKRLEARGAVVNTTSHSLSGPITYLGVDKATTIDRLTLQGQSFVDADLAALTTLPNLKQLSLTDTSITLLAAGRMPETCQVPWPMAPSEATYAYCRQRDADMYLDPCLAVIAHDWALKWKLACARCEGSAAAEQAAYRQCINNLSKLRDPGLTKRLVGDEIYAAKIAALEMQLAECEGNIAKAIEIGEAWQVRMENVEQSIWPTKVDLSYPYQGDRFLLITRLTREIRGKTAHFRNDQQAELQASDDAFTEIRTTLRTLLSPARDSMHKQMRDRWVSSMVIALEAEQLHRIQIAGETISEADDINMVRRLKMARNDLVGKFDDNAAYHLENRLQAILAWADQLIAEARNRHEAIAKDPLFDEDYTTYRHALAAYDFERLSVYSSASDASHLIAYLLRRQEPTGISVCQLKQHDLHRLFPSQVKWHGWGYERPTTDDWRREFPELNIVLKKPPR